MSTVRVVPDSTTVEVIILGVPTTALGVDELPLRLLPEDTLVKSPVAEALVDDLIKEELGLPDEEGLSGATDEELLLVLIMLLEVPDLVELAEPT